MLTLCVLALFCGIAGVIAAICTCFCIYRFFITKDDGYIGAGIACFVATGMLFTACALIVDEILLL